MCLQGGEVSQHRSEGKERKERDRKENPSLEEWL